MSVSVDESYRHCRQAARAAGSNFYWSFHFLPKAKRRSMYALYAFARRTDDLADSDESLDVRRENLRQWRVSLAAALEGRSEHPLLPALADTARCFSLPAEHLHAIIDGVEIDLRQNRFETFAELEPYCRLVASAVGLACLYIWEFTSNEALDLAVDCGVAFQLTNIIRDTAADAALDRIYLPQEDLRRFGLTDDDLKRGEFDERMAELMMFEIERAEQYYCRAAPLAAMLHRDGRGMFRAMFHTYRALLAEIRKRNGDVFAERVRLSWSGKLAIVARSYAAGLIRSTRS